jgi:hypothetical protein
MMIKYLSLSLGITAAVSLYVNNINYQSAVQTFADSTKKVITVHNKEAVQLYPNPTKNGTVTVSSNKTEKLHFYVFQLDGTLQHQAILKDKQKHIIQHLKKGVYTYDAFLNDVSIEHGEIIVK